jgi:hypothetical protein
MVVLVAPQVDNRSLPAWRLQAVAVLAAQALPVPAVPAAPAGRVLALDY